MFEWMEYLHPEIKEQKKPLSSQVADTLRRFKKE